MIKKIVMLEMTKQIFPTKKWLSKETKTLRDDDNQTKKNQLLQKEKRILSRFCEFNEEKTDETSFTNSTLKRRLLRESKLR